MSNTKSNTKPTESTDCHDLYIKEKQTKIVDNAIVNYKQFDLYLTRIDHEDVLSKILHQLQTAEKYDECHVYIQSPGGSMHQGIVLSDCLNSYFTGRINTEILYKADSMSSLLFCSGNKRIVNVNSRNMMHNYSTGYYGKASDIKTRVEFTDKYLTKYIKRMYLESGFLTKKEFKKLVNGKEYWFDSKEMLKRGIATHLRADGKIIDNKEALEFLSVALC